MRQNMKITSISPAEGWYAVYLEPGEEGKWYKMPVAVWAAVEYDGDYDDTGRLPEVLGMTRNDGCLSEADDPPCNFYGYYHQSELELELREELKAASIEEYKLKHRGDLVA